MRIAQEEIFGPVLAILEWSDEQDMLAEVTGMQLYCMQLARLEESGRLTDTIAGTVDRLVVSPERVRIVDYKTGAAPRPVAEARALFLDFAHAPDAAAREGRNFENLLARLFVGDALRRAGAELADAPSAETPAAVRANGLLGGSDAVVWTARSLPARPRAPARPRTAWSSPRPRPGRRRSRTSPIARRSGS